MSVPTYELEFYEDEDGDSPVLRWLREELTPTKRRAPGHAMNEVLQHLGVGVCGTEFGKQLGGGLFEFRLRRDIREVVPVGAAEAGKILRRSNWLGPGFATGAVASPGRRGAVDA